MFSLLSWATAEESGGPYTSGASDLEPRISWWWRVAEVRRPAAQLAAAASPRDTTAAGQVHAA